MKTKSGTTVPGNLATSLHQRSGILSMWSKLRPSCQKKYADSVQRANSPEARERRIRAVLRMTKQYYQQHH
jgi:uncharacterized protein YdeI (YjbR/CyaY-like superfamily)